MLMLFSCQLVRIHVRKAVRFLPKQDRLPPHFHSKTRQLGKNCKMVYCSFRQNLMGQFIRLFATCVSVAVYEASVSPSFKYNTTYYPDNFRTKQFQMIVLHLMTKKTNYSYRVFVHVKKYAFKGPQKRELNSNRNWVGFETNKKLYYKLRGIELITYQFNTSRMLRKVTFVGDKGG